MGRIRTIKPEFFKHEDLFDAEADTGLPLRIAFAGLWTKCDREGRFEWRPRALKSDILPYDNVDFAHVLDVLARAGFVSQYEVGGRQYGLVPSFRKHQVINQREKKSEIPAPGEGTEAHVQAHARENESVSCAIPKEVRAATFARDNSTCVRCGAKDDLTIDHIFPRSMGGNHAPANLRTLCKSCNSARPVAGEALVEDLKKDGFSTDDMERMCTHVHARGEGEGEGEQDTLPNGSDGDAVDARNDAVWKRGKPFLVERGVEPKKAGSCIGMWLRDHGADAVYDALSEAAKSPTEDPIPYINAILTPAPDVSAMVSDAVKRMPHA